MISINVGFRKLIILIIFNEIVKSYLVIKIEMYLIRIIYCLVMIELNVSDFNE